MREFYAARGGELGDMTAAEYDYILNAYLQAVNPDAYGKLVAEYRAMLLARINLDRACLIVSLPYQRYRRYYVSMGLSSDMQRCRARIGELERNAKETAEAYAKSADTQEETGERNWFDDMTREVAVLSKYLGFAVDVNATSIGVYIGYLRLMVEESRQSNRKTL